MGVRIELVQGLRAQGAMWHVQQNLRSCKKVGRNRATHEAPAPCAAAIPTYVLDLDATCPTGQGIRGHGAVGLACSLGFSGCSATFAKI